MKTTRIARHNESFQIALMCCKPELTVLWKYSCYPAHDDVTMRYSQCGTVCTFRKPTHCLAFLNDTFREAYVFFYTGVSYTSACKKKSCYLRNFLVRSTAHQWRRNLLSYLWCLGSWPASVVSCWMRWLHTWYITIILLNAQRTVFTIIVELIVIQRGRSWTLTQSLWKTLDGSYTRLLGEIYITSQGRRTCHSLTLRAMCIDATVNHFIILKIKGLKKRSPENETERHCQ